MSVYVLNIPLNTSQDLGIPPPSAVPASACMFAHFYSSLRHSFGHVLFLFVYGRKQAEDMIRFSTGGVCGVKTRESVLLFPSVFAVSSASSGVGARLSSGRIEYQQR